jgi:hypothetical protein
MILYYQKHRHTSLYLGKPFYPTQVEQLAYSTQKHLLKRVDPRIVDKSLGKYLQKGCSHQINAIT